MICAIPSKGRAGQVITTRLFPDAWVVVPESEGKLYTLFHKNVLTHPDHFNLAQARNYILDNIDDEIILQCDDDLEYLGYFGDADQRGGYYKKSKDPEYIWAVMSNIANAAKALGTNLFGVSEIVDLRLLNYKRPFSTRERINGLSMGIIKDGQRFDQRFPLKQDYDFYLMTLYNKRFVWRDDRYAFQAKHWTNTGGLISSRTMELNANCIKLLQRKYGSQVVQPNKKMPWKLTIHT